MAQGDEALKRAGSRDLAVIKGVGTTKVTKQDGGQTELNNVGVCAETGEVWDLN